jgi:hypothetical protein
MKQTKANASANPNEVKRNQLPIEQLPNICFSHHPTF